MTIATTGRKGLALFTITALTAVVEAILANPKAYNQYDFVQEFESENERGCIAFHHIKLTRTARQLKNLVAKHQQWKNQIFGSRNSINPFWIAVQRDLKLSEEQANRLLEVPEFWPLKFADRYDNAKTAKGRARVLADRIAFFIKTDGTDLTEKEHKALDKKAAEEKATLDAERQAQPRASKPVTTKVVELPDADNGYDDFDGDEDSNDEDEIIRATDVDDDDDDYSPNR